ncbi:MAG TPA: alpha/beta hydrolase-fold protein [Gaiellales bacterium]|jgi:S-formylglutathione hydrolase FrmB
MRGALRTLALALVLASVSAPLGAAAAAPRGSLVTRSVWSSALGHSVRTLVYLPPSYDPNGPRLPTLYLLHGTPGTPDGLFALGVGDRLDSLIAAGAPAMIVVAPSGGRRPDSDTEWDDAVADAGARWGTFVTRDLVRTIDADYRTQPTRAGRAIAGISMGGYGAINLALGHTGTYAIASSWSGYFVSNTPSVDGPHGSASWRARSPLLAVAARAPALRRQPVATSFYSGRADRFFGENVSFDRTLSQLGIPHRFRAVPGGHDAAVWRAQMTTELRWIGREFQRAGSVASPSAAR